nr:intraflagellar transport protein 74 homolog isoform X1 [Ipomoea batatas]
MDEYLQCMKTLRSQMNDVEDQATKISVEEQMQLTTVQTLEGDLNSVKRQTIQLKEDIDKMVKAKGEICSLILEKRRKISSLEGNSSTLYQVPIFISFLILKCNQRSCEKAFSFLIAMNRI